MYLEAKSMDEDWNEFNVENWKEEVLGQPVQPDKSSCGVFVCLVKYFVASFKDLNLSVCIQAATIYQNYHYYYHPLLLLSL